MKKIFFSFALFVFAFTFYTILTLLIFKWIDPPTTSFIQQSNMSSFQSVLHKDKVNQAWISIEKISDDIKIAIITSEDQKFLDHNGFDVKQIQKAIEDFEKGKKLRGASTISQQVAKNMFLSSERSWIRKGLETYYTLLIELIWSKKRIMEVYLNIAEFGDGVYGVEAASGYYFKKSSSYLNKREGAMLASILPNPKNSNLKKPSNYLNYRIERILSEKHNLPKKQILNELK